MLNTLKDIAYRSTCDSYINNVYVFDSEGSSYNMVTSTFWFFSFSIVVTDHVCPYLIDVTNGGFCITGNLTTVRVNYYCNFNFDLVGINILICGDNGQWNENPPVCKRMLYLHIVL